MQYYILLFGILLFIGTNLKYCQSDENIYQIKIAQIKNKNNKNHTQNVPYLVESNNNFENNKISLELEKNPISINKIINKSNQ